MAEQVTQMCPRCKGTGDIHGEYRFVEGQKVRVRHGGRWYDGEIVERFVQPSHFGGGLTDFYRVCFVLKSGAERIETFNLGINPVEEKADA